MVPIVAPDLPAVQSEHVAQPPSAPPGPACGRNHRPGSTGTDLEIAQHPEHFGVDFDRLLFSTIMAPNITRATCSKLIWCG